MRVSGITGGAPRAYPLPQDMLYAFYFGFTSGGKGEQLLHVWYKHLACGTSIHERDEIYFWLIDSPKNTTTKPKKLHVLNLIH